MKDPKSPIYCHEPSTFPKVPHYAIVEFSEIYIPGDERSRTNPGHGYPASSEPRASYTAYLDRETWETEVKKELRSRRDTVMNGLLSTQTPQR